jgi:hypothetical protein
MLNAASENLADHFPLHASGTGSEPKGRQFSRKTMRAT